MFFSDCSEAPVAGKINGTGSNCPRLHTIETFRLSLGAPAELLGSKEKRKEKVEVLISIDMQHKSTVVQHSD